MFWVWDELYIQKVVGLDELYRQQTKLRQIKAQIQHPNNMHRLYKRPVYIQVNCGDWCIGIKRTAGLHALKILLMYYMK